MSEEETPVERRKTHEEEHQALVDAITKTLDARYRIFSKKILRAVAMIGVAAIAAGVISYVAYHRSAGEAKNRATALAKGAHNAIQANVNARFDDCIAGDSVRAALYAQALQGKKTNPVLLQLLPALDTPQVKKLIKQNENRALRAFHVRGPDGCGAYALKSVPRRVRHTYSVPKPPVKPKAP